MIAQAPNWPKSPIWVIPNSVKILSAFLNCYTVNRILLGKQLHNSNRLDTVRKSILSAILPLCNLLKLHYCHTVRTVIYKESWLATLVGHASLSVLSRSVKNWFPRFFIISRLLCPGWCLCSWFKAPVPGTEMVGYFFIKRPKKHPYKHPYTKYRYKPTPALCWCQIYYLKPLYRR
jgi:hypothetical protein